MEGSLQQRPLRELADSPLPDDHVVECAHLDEVQRLFELLRDPQVRLARLGDAVIAGSARSGVPGTPGSNRSPSFFRSSLLCGFGFSPGHGAPSGAAVACRAAGGHADVALPNAAHHRRALDCDCARNASLKYLSRLSMYSVLMARGARNVLKIASSEAAPQNDEP